MEAVYDVTCKAVHAKFTDPQASGARQYLLDTQDTVLGEATRNARWGIGMHVSDENCIDCNNWMGENWMGQCLMDVRKYLHDKRESQSEASDVTPSALGRVVHHH